METNKYVLGLYDNENTLLKAVKAIRGAGVEISDALTPFPVHGLEHALGLRDSRLHTAGFMFGATGTTLALALMTWVSTTNYPLNVGGKPYFALPSFIPITFELTVLFAGVGMVLVYMTRNKLWPGKIPRIFDSRITDDRFALTFAVYDDMTEDDINKIKGLLEQTGAVEVKDRYFDEDLEEEELFI
jgi:hypothetical protein